MPSVKKFSMILNNIETIIENPCAPKWDNIVTPAIPAAKDVIIFLITPSIVDILQNWAHPKFGRRRHRGRRPKFYERQETRRGEKRVVSKWGLPDLDEIIAEKIPGRAYFGQRVAGPKESWAWFGLDLLDRLQWYWLVASLAEEFVYEWSSGIVQSNFCSEKFNALFQASQSVYDPAYRWALTVMYPQSTPTMKVSGANLITQSGKPFSGNFVFDVSVHNPAVVSRTVSWRTVYTDATGQHVQDWPIHMAPHTTGRTQVLLTVDRTFGINIQQNHIEPGTEIGPSYISFFGRQVD